MPAVSLLAKPILFSPMLIRCQVTVLNAVKNEPAAGDDFDASAFMVRSTRVFIGLLKLLQSPLTVFNAYSRQVGQGRLVRAHNKNWPFAGPAASWVIVHFTPFEE
jgi:hypothetical protein